MSVRVCVCVSVRACVSVCERVCVHASACGCERVCVHTRACVLEKLLVHTVVSLILCTLHFKSEQDECSLGSKINLMESSELIC